MKKRIEKKKNEKEIPSYLHFSKIGYIKEKSEGEDENSKNYKIMTARVRE